MELLAVRQARLIAWLSVEELNPKGRPIAHDFYNAFTERYKFLKRPMTADEILDPENRGIVFELGKLDDIGITKVTLFDWGIAIDTNASTDASDQVLQDMLRWGAETFELSNRPNLITKKAYLSELVFSSDILALSAINETVQAIGGHITELVKAYAGNSSPFEITGISLAFDPSLSKQLYTPFQLHRLADTAFSEKKYYTGAPLRTSDHVEVINVFEELLTNGKKSKS
jgi:hypothetical protein